MIKKLGIFFVIGCLLIFSALTAATYYYYNGREIQMNPSQNLQITIHPEDQQNRESQMHREVKDVPIEQLRSEIISLLQRSYRNYNINVKIVDGTVTLIGVVNSSRDKSDIENAVLNIEGVRKVNNKLQVTPQHDPQDYSP